MQNVVFQKVRIKELMAQWQNNFKRDTRCFVVSGYSNADSCGSSSWQDKRILC